MVEDTRTGRLLRRDPDGSVDVARDGLAFANGVALAADESFVVVAETAGPHDRPPPAGRGRAGDDFLVDDLPGYPDNIARGSDGLIWVTIASPTDPLVERLQRAPGSMRRGPRGSRSALQPDPKRTVRVQAYDADGRWSTTSTPTPRGSTWSPGCGSTRGRVWLGSLHEPAVAVLDTPGFA